MNLTHLGLALALFWGLFFAIKRVKARAENHDEEKSDWSMIDWGDEGGPKILLSRDHRPMDARARFSTAVVIEWRYASEGLPNQQTMESISRLESALEELRRDQSAIHVHTLTGNGLREWCHYTANYPSFEVRFNELVAKLPRMPLEVSFQSDPSWGYWQKIKLVALGNGA